MAEGPSPLENVPDGACDEYMAVTLRCVEQMASAGTFPVDQLEQVREALEQSLSARADATPEQRAVMEEACRRALEQQATQRSRSGCSP